MNTQIITSRSNPLVKEIVSLHQRKGREISGAFWAEGTKNIECLIDLNCSAVQKIVVSETAAGKITSLAKRAEKTGMAVQMFSNDCFSKISALKHPEGIGAVVKTNCSNSLPEKLNKPAIVLWQLNDPGNQGTIIRSAVALGFNPIIFVEPCVDIFHPVCVRAASGALFRADLLSVLPEKIIPWLTLRETVSIALTPDGKRNINSIDFPDNGILIIGNEPHGLPESIRNKFISAGITMRSGVESLNTCSAASIAMYELHGKAEVKHN